ncbi:P-loop containing nucleoside triphosphate hydrolase protein [Suillus clintonianus]|uniref:P-loop containing nucleoside triphosphate hydrolase protein n=1 Tax=Suillus clintonianus TaxID=1904413 RepID=UPI001B85CDE0|nr:P-loop containing nucleoside triphosphate hydrolase protein [Suillus clintonianus]KAG2130272.1 P-loop containing nucleoside triphosphate hydrolase protein [Suillus clintonianus]
MTTSVNSPSQVPVNCRAPNHPILRSAFKILRIVAVSQKSLDHWKDTRNREWKEHVKMMVNRFQNSNVTAGLVLATLTTTLFLSSQPPIEHLMAYNTPISYIFAMVAFAPPTKTWKASKYTGHADFGMEVGSASCVVDGAVVLIDSVEGVEAQTKSVWRQLDRYGVPTRLRFLNKLDRPGASFRSSLVSLLTHRLRPNPMVLALPIASFHTEDYMRAEPGIQALVDLVKRELWKWEEDGNSAILPLPDKRYHSGEPSNNAAPCGRSDNSFGKPLDVLR